MKTKEITSRSCNLRLDYLDSVRGMAALSVLLAHYVSAYGMPEAIKKFSTNTPLHIWWDAQAAIAMFFVLSGLVLSIKYFRVYAGAEPEILLGHFVISRIGRIWIPYAGVFLLSLLIRQFLFFPTITTPAQSGWITTLPWKQDHTWKLLFNEFSLITTGGTTTVIPQAWTLYFELIVSILVPAAVIVARKSSWWLIFFILFGRITRQATEYTYYFALGVLIAKNFKLIQAELGKWPTLWKTGVFFLGIIIYTSRFSLFPYLPQGVQDSTGGWIGQVVATGSAILLIAIISSNWLMQILSHWLLCALGRISYSLYLCHIAVMLSFTPFLLSCLNKFGFTSYVFCWSSGLVGTIIVSLLVSSVLYRYLEIPSINIGKKVAMTMFPPRSPR